MPNEKEIKKVIQAPISYAKTTLNALVVQRNTSDYNLNLKMTT